jgi:hypothetical protein
MTTPDNARSPRPGPTRGARDVYDHHELVASWTPDHGIDPGDSHDKGESFCVGEAA